MGLTALQQTRGRMDSAAEPEIEEMMRWISSTLSELNIGLLIYHLEDTADSSSLRLLYANDAASQYTGANLSARVGKRILEAFPPLADSHLPGLYADVVREGRSREAGVSEFAGDNEVERGHYAVKAFPMPRECVGVVFENVTLRKRLEEMVKATMLR